MNNTFSQTTLSTTSHNHLQKLLKLVAEGNLDAVEKCLSSAEFEENDLNQAIFMCISNFSTLRNHTECLFVLLRQKKANPNCIINDRTPLMAACATGQQPLIRCLLENGAKVDVRDSNYNHPLFYIMNIDSQNYDAAELIIEKMQTANIQISRKIPALVFAIQKQHQRIAKKLIQKGANLGFLSEEGDTIMHIVCKKQFSKVAKQKRLIRLLVSKVNNIHFKNKQNKTPLDYNQELKQMILQSSKPKTKQKEKEKKKDDTIDLEEEELAQQFADDFDEFSTRKDSKDQQTDKKLDQIEEEFEDQKKEENQRDKDKGAAKPRKSINSNAHVAPKGKEVKEAKPPVVTSKTPAPKPKEKQKPLSKFEKKTSNKTIKPAIIKTEPSVQVIKQQNRQREKEKSRDRQKDREKHKERQREKEIALAEIQLKQILSKNKAKMQKIEKLQVELQQMRKKEPDLDGQYYANSSKHWMLTKEELSQVLTLEINDFVADQIKQCSTFFEVNLEICRIINSLFAEKFSDVKPQIYQFGSQTYGLCLNFSDTDLVIASRSQPFELFMRIEDSRIFQNPELFKQAKFIKNASIPIIKLQMSSKYMSRRVDISFQTAFHNGLRCSNLVRQFMEEEPLIRPLTLVLKKFMFSRNLNDTYTGGLGSYSIVLMVVALLQSTTIDKKHPHSVGRLLLEFLFFYGYQMDYICKSILLYSPKFKDFPTYNVFPLPNTQDITPKLVIYDPLNPVNNVGRPTYKIFEIKLLFMETYNKLFYNIRCPDRHCRWKKAMTPDERKERPCCLLSRLFV